MHNDAFIPFKLRYIRQPLLIRSISSEHTVEDVICDILWVISLSCTPVIAVFDRRFNIHCSADTQYTFVIDVDVVISIKIIIDPAVTFGWVIVMDVFHNSGDPFILPDTLTRVAPEPFVVG
jgi:hypothetical protein